MNTPTRKTPARKTRGAVLLDLALQGGGSHGAFTWGVLDRLLQDDSLQISGVSGTSAGALNAGVLATGYASGGREGARRALREFWHEVSGQRGCFGSAPMPSAGGLPGLPTMPGLAGFNPSNWPGFGLLNSFLQVFSPYQFNPLNLNALRDIARRHVDEDALRRGPLALFIAATSVHTGQARVFSGADLSVDALLASACLPQLFQAVVIDGQPYWDGGYSGNPVLWPLIYNTPALDLLLVRIDPLVRPGTPDTPMEISDRVNEITFNAVLAAEMRAIAFVQKLLKGRKVDPTHYKDLRVHGISDEPGLAPFNGSSKLNTDWQFLQTLHALGLKAAQGWLEGDRRHVGKRSSLDIEGLFLAPRAG